MKVRSARSLAIGIVSLAVLLLVLACAASILPLLESPGSSDPRLRYGLLGLCLLSGILLIGLTLLYLKSSARLALQPFRESIKAGSWVLRKALGREPQGASTATTAGLEDQLEKWLDRLRGEMATEAENRVGDLKSDLEVAKDFQLAFLNRPYPKVPDVHVEGRLRLEFYHRYQPMSALGGDFFDIIHPAPDCAGIMIADVMGHGTRSALITATLRAMSGRLVSQGRHAPLFLTEMNRELARLLEAADTLLFASAFYFVADVTSRMATYASAGHPPPFYVHRDRGRIAQLDIPKPHGTALGVTKDEEYKGGNIRLQDGDFFVFFTDGVFEAKNAAEEEFGLKRMESVIRNHMYDGIREVVDGIRDQVLAFVGGEENMDDDICILAVRVTTEGEK